MRLRMPNTFVLLFAILALIALATWLVPGGKYETHLVNGKQLVDPTTFHYVASAPQGLTGATVWLDFPSVGATENVLMAAVLASGTTVIDKGSTTRDIVAAPEGDGQDARATAN